MGVRSDAFPAHRIGAFPQYRARRGQRPPRSCALSTPRRSCTPLVPPRARARRSFSSSLAVSVAYDAGMVTIEGQEEGDDEKDNEVDCGTGGVGVVGVGCGRDGRDAARRGRHARRTDEAGQASALARTEGGGAADARVGGPVIGTGARTGLRGRAGQVRGSRARGHRHGVDGARGVPRLPAQQHRGARPRRGQLHVVDGRLQRSVLR